MAINVCRRELERNTTITSDYSQDDNVAVGEIRGLAR